MPKRRGRGEGTVYQRKDGLWCGQITMPDGKRKTKYHKSQKPVRDWLTEQRQAIHHGDWARGEDVTVGEFIERYLKEVATNNVRQQTMMGYWDCYNFHIKPALGRVKLSTLRPDQIQSLYTKMSADGLAPGTILATHGVLHQAFKQAVAWSMVPRNPVALAKPPRRDNKPTQLMNAADLQRFLEITRGNWLGVLATLAVTTGLRRGELLALTWKDVDLEHSFIDVHQSVVRVDGVVRLDEPKTRAGRRKVTLPKMALEALTTYRETNKSDLLFPSSRGGLMNPDVVSGLWRRRLEQFHLPLVTFHSLRHLHSTMLLESGISPKVVQERLGHASIAITLGIYSHVTTRLERGAADAIDVALKQP